MAKFLYNGMLLPDINEVWTDKEKYKSAIIYKHELPTDANVAYHLVLAASEECGFLGEDVIRMYNPSATYLLRLDNMDAWVLSGKTDDSTFGLNYSINLVDWASFDVYDKDGNLYLAASEPVPVNVNPPDPLSLVMGYRVGCAIRANR